MENSRNSAHFNTPGAYTGFVGETLAPDGVSLFGGGVCVARQLQFIRPGRPVAWLPRGRLARCPLGGRSANGVRFAQSYARRSSGGGGLCGPGGAEIFNTDGWEGVCHARQTINSTTATRDLSRPGDHPGHGSKRAPVAANRDREIRYLRDPAPSD